MISQEVANKQNLLSLVLSWCDANMLYDQSRQSGYMSSEDFATLFKFFIVFINNSTKVGYVTTIGYHQLLLLTAALMF